MCIINILPDSMVRAILSFLDIQFVSNYKDLNFRVYQYLHFFGINIYNVNAYLDASEFFISGNEPSSEMLTYKAKNWTEEIYVKPNNLDLRMSQETKVIWI